MASTTDFIDVTTAASFIPEVWTSAAIVQREARLVHAGLFDRRFEEYLRFGDILHVPTLGNLAARQKSANTAVTYETVTETLVNITVDQHWYAAIAVEDIVDVQANRDQMEAYAGKLTYAVAVKIDTILAGLTDDLNNTVGTLAVELEADDWIRAIQYLDDEMVPPEGRFAIISPAQKSGLLKMDKYISNDYTLVHGGDARATRLEYSYTRSFFDMPVYVTTQVEGSNTAGHDNFMGHREVFALVLQMAPKLRSQYDIDYLADKVVLEELYGTQEMRDDATYGRYGVFMQGA